MLAADGWIRKDHGLWSGLWHVSPKGWSGIPGHGHEDFGSFELHFGNEPVLIDPGRGSYGDKSEAALYRSGAVHNLLLVDGLILFPRISHIITNHLDIISAGIGQKLRILQY